MKIAWKKNAEEREKKRSRPNSLIPLNPNLPFDSASAKDAGEAEKNHQHPQSDSKALDQKQLAERFQSEGNHLAEDGKFREALGKWEAAITLLPEKAVLHEQKAQVLLEIGDAWSALRAASRATELEPSWAEAWITLGRAQLNFGEPDSAIESFDRALAITPNNEEASADRRIAVHLAKKRKQLQLSGLSNADSRYHVRDKAEMS